jgi:hypothetical protein
MADSGASSCSNLNTESLVSIPRVVKFAYLDYKVCANKSAATCKFCVNSKVVISEKPGTTSNYVRHLERVHPSRLVFLFL